MFLVLTHRLSANGLAGPPYGKQAASFISNLYLISIFRTYSLIDCESISSNGCRPGELGFGDISSASGKVGSSLGKNPCG